MLIIKREWKVSMKCDAYNQKKVEVLRKCYAYNQNKVKSIKEMSRL